jgi:hypothetical protein
MGIRNSNPKTAAEALECLSRALEDIAELDPNRLHRT